MTSNRDCTDLMNNLDQIEKIADKWFITNKLKLNNDESQKMKV